MELVILGSGTSYPSGHKGPSSLWVSSGDTSILVDCGSGTCQKMTRAGGDLSQVDAVLLTHAHLDHMSDLPMLLFALRSPGFNRKKPLQVLHSPLMTPYLDGLRHTFGEWLVPKTCEVHYRALQPGCTVDLGSLKITTFEVRHHATSLGFRIADLRGVSLAIPSDTALCPSLIEAVRLVDCLLIECAATDDHPLDGHLSPADLLTVLDSAKPASVLLTHLYPKAEKADVVWQVQSKATCPVVAAQDGLALAIRRGGIITSNENVLSDTELPSDDATAWAEASALSEGASPQISREDSELMRGILERALQGMDSDAMTSMKFDVDETSGAHSPETTVHDEWGFEAQLRQTRHWSPADLLEITLNREQHRLLKRVSQDVIQAEINLRGSTKDDALGRLKAVVPTWVENRVVLARVITGKGKQSEVDPVVKLAVLNWLEGAEGQRYVKNWAPQMTADRNFGSIILELRTSRARR